MLPWGSLLSKEDVNKPSFEADACFSYSQAEWPGSYKEHPDPPFPFTLSF